MAKAIEDEARAAAGESRRPLEWPTLALAALIYGGWIAATLLHDRLHPLVLAAVGGWLTAWHGSLQHEAIHGHPTPWRRVNDAIVCAPLSLWLPYEIYRRTHIAHHASEHLAHPRHDPEARYLPAGAGWRHSLTVAAGRLQSTLLGRVVLGPLFEVAQFLRREAGRVVRNEAGARADWARHLAMVAVLWAWLHLVCGLGLATYLACFVYPGLALTLVRSFAEHRADALAGRAGGGSRTGAAAGPALPQQQSPRRPSCLARPGLVAAATRLPASSDGAAHRERRPGLPRLCGGFRALPYSSARCPGASELSRSPRG